MNHALTDPAHLRPGFPKGLHVLLVDENCAPIEAQLRQPELQYAVTCATNAMEALELLRHANVNFAKSTQYDIVLAEARLVAMEDTTGKAFIDACEGVPVLLMAEQGSAKDVLRSVQLGAVDFLDKPLSTLKLKNIWQHCVRKMMRSTSSKNIPKNFEVTRPCYSADVVRSAHNQVPVPSSMTGPIVPGASPGYVCAGIAGYAGAYGSVGNQLCLLGENGKPVASPQTPSGSDMEGAAGESTSAASNHDGQKNSDKDDDKMDDGDVKSRKKKVVVRRKKLAEVVETREWPALAAGCTWGTPVGSVLPPPMDRNKCETSLDNAVTRASLPAGLPTNLTNAHSSAETGDPSIQRCIIRTPGLSSGGDSKVGMQSGQFFKNAPGGAPPLGLQLRKTDSLLNLINDHLGA